MSKVYSGKSDQLYQEFYKKFKKAHFDKSGNWVTTAAVKVWRESLDHGKDMSKYKEEMAVLDGLILKKQNVTIKGFFVKQQEKKAANKTQTAQSTSKGQEDEGLSKNKSDKATALRQETMDITLAAEVDS